MTIKAVDIARSLGVSKATVSLALNRKPGVSEETREAVLRCKAELEQQQFSLSLKNERTAFVATASGLTDFEQPQMIKIVMFDRQLCVICDPALNLWANSLRLFDSEAKKYGYSISITYADNNPTDIENVIAECNHTSVAGVLLFATEMCKEDFPQFAAIQKPIVVYDNNFSDYHCVVADNEDITQESVRYLAKQGYKRILYLAQKVNIYNFERRKIGFIAGIYLEKLNRDECPILETGLSIADIEAYMTNWLQNNPLPDAFIMENYQVSIGTVHALQSLGIRIPEQIGLLGIDEVPSYTTSDLQLTCMQIDHTHRASSAIALLIQEIQKNDIKPTLKVVSRSKLVEGNSLK